MYLDTRSGSETAYPKWLQIANNKLGWITDRAINISIWDWGQCSTNSLVFQSKSVCATCSVLTFWKYNCLGLFIWPVSLIFSAQLFSLLVKFLQTPNRYKRSVRPCCLLHCWCRPLSLVYVFLVGNVLLGPVSLLYVVTDYNALAHKVKFLAIILNLYLIFYTAIKVFLILILQQGRITEYRKRLSLHSCCRLDHLRGGVIALYNVMHMNYLCIWITYSYSYYYSCQVGS